MNPLRLALLLILTAATAIAQTANVSQNDAAKPAPPPSIRSFDPAAIDKTADPCTSSAAAVVTDAIHRVRIFIDIPFFRLSAL